MNHIENMITAARDSNPVQFNKSFASEMRDRVIAAIGERRADVMTNSIAPAQQENSSND